MQYLLLRGIKFPISLIRTIPRYCFNNDVNVKHDLFVYDLPEKVSPQAPKRQKYEVPLKTRQKKALEKQQFEQFRAEQQALAEKEINKAKVKEGKGVQEKVPDSVEVDELWGSNVPIRAIDSISNKEVHWFARDENYFSRSEHQIAFLKHFVQPFTLHDGELTEELAALMALAGSELLQNRDPTIKIEDFYASDPKAVEILQRLRKQVLQVNYKLMPDFALKLAFEVRYKTDFAHLWETIATRVQQQLHHFTPIEMAKLRYAFAGTFPKAGSALLQQAMIDILTLELHRCTLDELFHILWAFRSLHSDKIQSRLIKEIVLRLEAANKTNKNEKALGEASAAKLPPDTYVNAVYLYLTCRLPQHKYKNYRYPAKSKSQRATDFIEALLDGLLPSIDTVSIDALARLAISLRLASAGQSLDDVRARLERQILHRHAEFTPRHTADVLYAFGKLLDLRAGGSEHLYHLLDKLVAKQWESFSDLERARIFYAYANRDVLAKEVLSTRYLPWVKTRLTHFSYQELQLVGYALMFQGVVDSAIWKQFVHRVVNQQLMCPIFNYAALKYVRYYVSVLYPKWNLAPYDEICREAETRLAITRMRKDHTKVETFHILSQILTERLQVKYVPALEYANLFIIDFAILPQKLAILLQHQGSQQVTRSPGAQYTRAIPLMHLKKRILEGEGWAVILLSWEEYVARGAKAEAWLQEQVQTLFQRQDTAYNAQAPQRYADMEERIYKIAELVTLPEGAIEEQMLQKDQLLED